LDGGAAATSDGESADAFDDTNPNPEGMGDAGFNANAGSDAVRPPAASADAAAIPGDGSAQLPPTGKTWLLIGQDVGSIDDYAQRVRPPGGVAGYTALDTLAGVTSTANWGAGDQSLVQLAGRYPKRPVALGLYLVGMIDRVTSGELDSQIDSLAGTLSSFGTLVLLRIGYEFDNPANGYSPTTYQAAFVHIVERVRAAGPSLIRSVWQSQASCQAGQSLNAWYPGDAYVDWVGLSYFQQHAGCNDSSVGAVAAFGRAHGKPVLVAESTPQGYDLTALTYSATGSGFQSVTPTEIWSAWFLPYFSFIHANQDVIGAVTYIDADWNTQPMWQNGQNGYWGDTRLQQNAAIQQMWISELQGSSWVQP
jgi:hypothetical protein